MARGGEGGCVSLSLFFWVGQGMPTCVGTGTPPGGAPSGVHRRFVAGGRWVPGTLVAQAPGWADGAGAGEEATVGVGVA